MKNKIQNHGLGIGNKTVFTINRILLRNVFLYNLRGVTNK